MTRSSCRVPQGLAIGLVLLAATAPRAARAATACTGVTGLKYYGGPVIQNAKIYYVGWGPNVGSTINAMMPAFYTALVQSSYLDWLSEYNTLGLNGQDRLGGSNQGISRGRYAGAVTITPSVCPGTSTCTVTDAQIQAELAAQIAAGVLPAPTLGCDGQNDTVYMIHFPATVTISGPGPSTSCVQFCYYVGAGTSNARAFSYAVLPDVTTGACAGGCGSSSVPISNQTAAASAALANAITDPGIANQTSIGRPLGWYDSICGGIADICNALQGTITVGAVEWTVQPLWSNAAASCIVGKTNPPPICTKPYTPPGCRACSCADDNQAAAGEIGCGGSTPRCELDTGNVKHGQCVACATDAQCTSGTCSKTTDVATDDMCVPPGNDGGVDAAAGAGGAVGAGGATGGGSGGAAGTVSGAAGAGGGAGAGVGGAGAHAEGTEGGACYGNGTCNTGLTCLSHLCGMQPKSGGGCGCRIGPASPGAELLTLALLVALCRRRRQRGCRTKILLTLIPALGAGGCGHSAAQCAATQPGQYFPAGAFQGTGSQAGRDASFQSWFGKQLCAMNEGPLTQRPADETYRFLWLRSFHHPVSVRIEVSRGKTSLVAVELDGTGGYEPGRVERRTERALTEQEWMSLTSALGAAKFWEAPTDDPREPVEDGAEWIFEGHRPGVYRVVTRSSPDGPLRSLGEKFLEVARFSFPAAEVY